MLIKIIDTFQMLKKTNPLHATRFLQYRRVIQAAPNRHGTDDRVDLLFFVERARQHESGQLLSFFCEQNKVVSYSHGTAVY